MAKQLTPVSRLFPHVAPKRVKQLLATEPIRVLVSLRELGQQLDRNRALNVVKTYNLTCAEADMKRRATRPTRSPPQFW
jgi:hypothetical protein